MKIIARLTQINHLRSVHPALDFRMRSDESVPDEADDDGENKACSGLPQIYWKITENNVISLIFTSKR